MSENPPSKIRHPKSAFTLVELLVVITIIGILIALLLPAVQAAREAARRLQCTNHLKQIALACLAHEENHEYLPSGGWGSGWAGDPDRGYGGRQPGGWIYNILPFLEQQALHDMGTTGREGKDSLDENEREKRRQCGLRAATPLTVLHCSSRRSAIAYPALLPYLYYNLDIPLTGSWIARTDYAACVGDCFDSTPFTNQASSYADGDSRSESCWAEQRYGAGRATGVCYLHSRLPMHEITDGSSNTFLVGEKYLDSEHYSDGIPGDDDQGWDVALDCDNVRWTNNHENFRPLQDTPSYSAHFIFGSAHAGSFHMSFCDGSVRAVNYSIDITTFSHLGNRKDGYVIDAKTY